jgi:hypothetical protein
LHFDLGSRAINLMEIGGGELYGNCSNVFFQPTEFRRPWNWNNPWLPGKQPGER